MAEETPPSEISELPAQNDASPEAEAAARHRARRTRRRTKTRATVVDLPVLAVRDTVLFPRMQAPLFVGREASLNAVEAAMAGDRTLMVVAQRVPELEEIDPEGLGAVGTEASIVRALKMPDGTTSVLVQGQRRLRANGPQQAQVVLGILLRPFVCHQQNPHQPAAMSQWCGNDRPEASRFGQIWPIVVLNVGQQNRLSLAEHVPRDGVFVLEHADAFR